MALYCMVLHSMIRFCIVQQPGAGSKGSPQEWG